VPNELATSVFEAVFSATFSKTFLVAEFFPCFATSSAFVHAMSTNETQVAKKYFCLLNNNK
jgi:hypothetical protein